MSEKYVVTQKAKKIFEINWSNWWSGFWAGMLGTYGLFLIYYLMNCERVQ